MRRNRSGTSGGPRWKILNIGGPLGIRGTALGYQNEKATDGKNATSLSLDGEID